MDKDMTTYAMLSTACDGFDELSVHSRENRNLGIVRSLGTAGALHGCDL